MDMEIRRRTLEHYCIKYPSNNNDNSNGNSISRIIKKSKQKQLKIYCLIRGELTSTKIDTWESSFQSFRKKRLIDDSNEIIWINVREPFNPNSTSHIVLDKKLYLAEEKRESLLNCINKSTNMKWKDFNEIKKKNIILVDINWMYEIVKQKMIIDYSSYIICTDDVSSKDVARSISKSAQSKQCYTSDESHNEVKDCREDIIKNLHAAAEMIGQSRSEVVFKSRAYIKMADFVRFKMNFPIYSIDQFKFYRNKSGNLYRLIKQTIELGYSVLVEERSKNPEVLAREVFCNVWGIGPATANELIQKGFFQSLLSSLLLPFSLPLSSLLLPGIYSIEDLRGAVSEKKVDLNEGQKIGLHRYEDLLERMCREEVEEIHERVMETARKIKPEIQGQVCGSYRRGKKDCGDIDILFSIPEGIEEDKKCLSSFLSELVAQLGDAGYLTDHLALPGASSRYRPTNFGRRKYKNYEHVVNDIDSHNDSTVQVESKLKCISTYMGIFKLKSEGSKHRRIDLKVYPRQCLPFALLYFTGSGQFNRSMRYCAIKKNGHLSDNSLVLSKVIQDSIRTEGDIFKALGIGYYEPHERNGWMDSSDMPWGKKEIIEAEDDSEDDNESDFDDVDVDVDADDLIDNVDDSIV